ncbi:MAG: hypothetical protein ACRCW9_10010 [Cetobacterium sp.]
MHRKIAEINNCKVLLFKSKVDGNVYIEYNSLSVLFKLNKYQKQKNKKELLESNYLLEFEDDKSKKYLLFPLNQTSIYNKIIKNLKREEEKNFVKQTKKGLITICKKEMKAYLPDVLVNCLLENKIEDYFLKLNDLSYYDDFFNINKNLYSIRKIKKIDFNKKVLKITKLRNTKKTIKENTYLKTTKDIELFLEKEKNKRNKIKYNKLMKIQNKLEKELDDSKTKYDFFVCSNYLYSYNKALIAAYTNKLVINPKYKSWKDGLVDYLKKTTYFKYIIEDRIFDFIKPNKIDFCLRIYIYIPDKNKAKGYLPDADNYIKPFQDAISEALGVDDKNFRIKEFEFVEVNAYEKQGYYFGLQKTKN